MRTETAMKAIRNSILALMGASLTCAVLAEEAATATPAAAEAPKAAEASTPAAAETVAPDTSAVREDHPDSYVVKKGDNLWDIANKFLKNPWMWPEIWHVNPQIANPHMIFPGDTINLVYLEGQPRLNVKRGEAGMTYKMSPETAASGEGESETATPTAVASSSSATSTTGAAQADKTPRQPGTVTGEQKLKPSIRVEPLEDPIPAIPLNIIGPFLNGNKIVGTDVLDKAPYVLQGGREHVIVGAGGEIYARGNFDKQTAAYGIFRQGKTYIDPDTKELLGVEAIDIGTAKIMSSTKDMARFEVIRSTQEVLPGDRLLVNQERKVDSIFYPVVPENKISGSIIAVPGGVSQIGPMSVVILNKGAREELRSGNVLAIFQQGDVVTDPVKGIRVQLPDERAGLVMVFAAFEKTSYGIVLYADRPLRVGDRVRKP